MATDIITSIVTGGTNNHPTTAQESNSIATDFVVNGVVGAVANTGGVSPATGGFAVNQSGTPAMTVDITAGVAYVTGTPAGQSSQNLRAKMASNYTAYAISANATGSTKYDWIYLKLDATKAANPSATADDVITLYTSRSTSNTSDNGTPPTYGLVLAVVTVSNGATSIVNANIADKRIESLFAATTTLVADIIAEKTSGAGVTADGVLLKDSAVYSDTISEKTSGAGVAIDSFAIKDGLPKNWNGWNTPDETWTYASASTFTVSGDQTTKYTKGTRLKWTQTTVKYGVVVASSYSAPNTTVTIAVNTNYTIANAAITDNYYSYAANPQGYPDRFRFTGVVTAPGGTAPTYTSNECYFSYTGGTINVSYLLSNSSGGTAGSGAVTLLVSSPTVAPATRCGFGAIYNGGTTIDSKIIMNFLAVGDGVSSTLYLAGDGAYNALASNQSNANRYIHLTLTYQF